MEPILRSERSQSKMAPLAERRLTKDQYEEPCSLNVITILLVNNHYICCVLAQFVLVTTLWSHFLELKTGRCVVLPCIGVCLDFCGIFAMCPLIRTVYMYIHKSCPHNALKPDFNMVTELHVLISHNSYTMCVYAMIIYILRT